MNSPTIAPSTKTFHLPKGRVQPILGALAELQKRTDLSGKFARKLARIRRKLSSVEGDVVAEANVIQDRFTKRDAEGKPLPVFQRNALGQVVFETDGDGKDTDIPQVEPGKVHLTDVAGYQKEMAEFEGERITSIAKPLSESEFDTFKAVRGDVIDALMDLGEDSEFCTEPEASAAAVPTGIEERSAP
jgi:hypothetical protein